MINHLKDDKPSIGMILCKSKKKLVVEYTLQDNKKPIGVASFKTQHDALPQELKEGLPTIEQIEHELNKNER